MLVAIVDIVLECCRIALDADFEQLLYSIAVIIERSARQRFTIGKISLFPQHIKFLTRNAAVAADSIDKPDVAAKQIS